MFTKKAIHIFLLACGLVSSLLYVTTDLLAVVRWKEYSYTDQTVSELIAIDAPARPFVVPLFMIYSILVILFGAGVWVSAGKKRALLFTGAFLAAKEVEGIIATLFAPMHLRGVEATLTDTMHGVLAMTGVVFMLTAIGFGASAFGKDFRRYSVLTMLLLVIGGSLSGMYVPEMTANQPTPWLGIMERVNIYTYMLWGIVLAIILLRANSKSIMTTGPSK